MGVRIMIIDSHVHFGSALNFDMKKEYVLEAMKKYKISAMIVSNCESTECNHQQKILPVSEQVKQIKSAIGAVQFARENPGKIYAAIWCKPLLEKPDDDLETLIKENLDVVKALKFHPYHSAVPFDDEKIESYMYLAEKYKLPVITHTGNTDYDSTDRVYSMAMRHKDIVFIMAHLGLGTDNMHAIELCQKLPNLYGDTAWVSMKSAVEFVKKCGSSKLLFGSDLPIDGVDTYLHNPLGERSVYQDYFHELFKHISSEDYENIMAKNAKTLFGI